MASKTIQKQKIICVAIFYAVFCCGMLIGTFYDLEIDKALFHYDNPFGIFMEKYAMLPQFSVQLCAFTALLAAYHPAGEAFDIAAAFLPALERIPKNRGTYAVLFILDHAMYAAFLYGAFQGSNQMLNFLLRTAAGGNIQDLLQDAGAPKFFAILVWTLVRLMPIALLLTVFRKTDKKIMKTVEFMAIVGLLMYYSVDIIEVLKAHFHRIRFREMIAYSHGLVNADGWTSRGNAMIPRSWIADTDFSAYGRWYIIGNDRGVYSEPTSFPSGHTTAAVFTMLLAPLFGKCKKLQPYFVPAFFVGFVYTLAMGISRLIRGAHWLTDISAAALIMFTICLLYTKILRLGEKRVLKNLQTTADSGNA
ncbi:MAG: phosphatase PAP2 family protein [Clostridia bacterium]|nr:phosphatase PAP2 family protein [Clostridia bacterium]